MAAVRLSSARQRMMHALMQGMPYQCCLLQRSSLMGPSRVHICAHQLRWPSSRPVKTLERHHQRRWDRLQSKHIASSQTRVGWGRGRVTILQLWPCVWPCVRHWSFVSLVFAPSD